MNFKTRSQNENIEVLKKVSKLEKYVLKLRWIRRKVNYCSVLPIDGA